MLRTDFPTPRAHTRYCQTLRKKKLGTSTAQLHSIKVLGSTRPVELEVVAQDLLEVARASEDSAREGSAVKEEALVPNSISRTSLVRLVVVPDVVGETRGRRFNKRKFWSVRISKFRPIYLSWMPRKARARTSTSHLWFSARLVMEMG